MDLTPLLEKISKKQIIALVGMYIVAKGNMTPTQYVCIAAIAVGAILVQGTLDWRGQDHTLLPPTP